jgi:hypothetical protein
MSIFVKSCLTSVLQAFGYGGGLGDRGLTWTGSRSSFLAQMARPFIRGSREKWLLGIERAKMVTTVEPSMHLQKASKLSRQWGPLHAIVVIVAIALIITFGQRKIPSAGPEDNY